MKNLQSIEELFESSDSTTVKLKHGSAKITKTWADGKKPKYHLKIDVNTEVDLDKLSKDWKSHVELIDEYIDHVVDFIKEKKK